MSTSYLNLDRGWVGKNKLRKQDVRGLETKGIMKNDRAGLGSRRAVRCELERWA